MPYFRVRTVNSTFDLTDEGAEYQDAEAAYQSAIDAGLDIAVGEVSSYSGTAILEVIVKDEGGATVARGAVAVSTQRFTISGSGVADQ